MSHAIDIKDVIQQTTSEVGLDQLQQKGFTKVKVLDRAAIKRMIAESVNKVLEERNQGLSETERVKLREEARAEFDNQMAEFRVNASKQKQELEQEVGVRETRIDKLREELLADREAIEQREAQLRARVSDLEAREERLTELAERAEEVNRHVREVEQRNEELQTRENLLREFEEAVREREIRLEIREESLDQTPTVTDGSMSDAIKAALREVQAEDRAEAKTEDLTELKESLQTLAANLARGGGGGGGSGSIAAATDAASIEALVQRAGTGAIDAENNLGAVEVKESKAKSVNANLAKLKNLKKGGS